MTKKIRVMNHPIGDTSKQAYYRDSYKSEGYLTDYVTNTAWNKRNVTKGLKLAGRLIAGTISTKSFINSGMPKKIKIKSPEKTIIKKVKAIPENIATTKKVKRKISIPLPEKKHQLEFKSFFKKFFPGCVLSEKDTDIHIPRKIALDYYRDYLKSGLKFAEYDTQMAV